MASVLRSPAKGGGQLRGYRGEEAVSVTLATPRAAAGVEVVTLDPGDGSSIPSLFDAGLPGYELQLYYGKLWDTPPKPKPAGEATLLFEPESREPRPIWYREPDPEIRARWRAHFAKQ